MEETRILLLFRDGVVNFDDVSEMQFFTLKKERVCRVRFRNGNVSVYSLYKDGVVPFVLPTAPFGVSQIAIFSDSAGNIAAQHFLG